MYKNTNGTLTKYKIKMAIEAQLSTSTRAKFH